MPRPRFSLRTLLLFVLLIASGSGLWWRWAPWVRVAELSNVCGYTNSRQPCLIQKHLNEYRLIDLETQRVTAVMAAPRIDDSQPDVLAAIHSSTTKHFCVVDGSRVYVGDWTSGKLQKLNLYYNSQVVLSNNERWLLIAEPPTIHDLDSGRDILHDSRSFVMTRKGNPSDEEQKKRLQACVAKAHACRNLAELQSALDPLLRIRLDFSPEGAVIMSSVDGETVQLWDAADGALINSVPTPYFGFKWHVSPDRRVLAVDTMNKIVFHDVASGKMTAIIEGSGQRFHSNFIGGHRHICDARGQRWLLRDRQGTQTQQMYDFESGGFHLLPLEGALSPDGERVGIATDSLELVSPVDGQVLFSMPDAWGDVYFVEQWLLVHRPGNRTDEKVFVYRQRRDERLIGVLQLPEFWLTLLFAGALLASLRADYRSLRRQQPPPPAPSPAAGEGAA